MSDQAETVTLEVPTAPIPVPQPAAQAPAEFSGAPGDLMKDLALLDAQQNPPTVPEPQAPEPVQPATATATPEVPEKFKDENGNADQAKIEKSTADAQAALTKYLAMEKDLRRKMNEVSGLQKQAPQSPTDAPATASPFAAQLEADMAKFGAGAVLERLFEAAKETAKAEAKRDVLSDVMADREERLEIKSRQELEQIAKFDQGVISPEGLEALARIRAERPWIEKAANPTSEAYKVYLADQVIKARLNGQVTPNPKGPAAKAPPTPVGPAPRVSVQPTAPVLQTKEDIDKHLSTLDEKGQEAFFKGFGLKFR